MIDIKRILYESILQEHREISVAVLVSHLLGVLGGCLFFFPPFKITAIALVVLVMMVLGKRKELSQPFLVLATQNPINHEGTYSHYSQSGQQTRVRHQFTIVKDIPRILAIGGPKQWIEPVPSEPPGFRISLLMDTSDSMNSSFQGGITFLDKARDVATAIVGKLRPGDRLSVTSFTFGASRLVENQKMDAEGKAKTLCQIPSFLPSDQYPLTVTIFTNPIRSKL